MRSKSSAEIVVSLLKKKGKTLCLAESITGGGLASAITDIAGSSEIFLGGFVTYSEKSKLKFLEIPKRLITKHTVVSEEVAIDMANSIREQFGADYAISTTGVAGPGSAYGQKAGTVWVAIADRKNCVAIALDISGDRATVRNSTIESALAAFSRILRA